MERPVMNPMFMQENEPPKKPPKPKLWKVVAGVVWRVAKRIGQTVASALLAWPQKDRLRIEDGTPIQRIVRGILYRLAFVPVVLVLFIVGLVFYVTHPQGKPPEADPSGYGMYYDSVKMTTEDGVELEGWIVPVLNARKVVENKEKILSKKDPAVILVHGFGANKQQMLPAVKPLHDSGCVVLILGLRGTTPGARQGQTFGVKEAFDVRAGLEALRSRSFVDADRIAIMGIGTGANAAMIAALSDSKVAALVLDSPIDGFDAAFAERIGSEGAWVRWLRPLFKWTFEVMYRVDSDQLEHERASKATENRPTLRFASAITTGEYHPRNMGGICRFLRVHGLGERAEVAGAK